MNNIDANDWIDLAYHIAWKYTRITETSVDELASDAMVGILKAIKSFDESRGRTFKSFAYLVANAEIKHRYFHKVNGELTPRSWTHKDVIIRNTAGLRTDKDGDWIDTDEKRLVNTISETPHDEAEIQSFIKSLPLEKKDKDYFSDIVEEGYPSPKANKLYMQDNGIRTKQRMGQIKNKVLSVAKERFEECYC